MVLSVTCAGNMRSRGWISGVNGFILGFYHPEKRDDGEIPNKEFMFKFGNFRLFH